MKFVKQYRWILLLLLISAVIRGIIFLQIMNTIPFSDYFDYRQWVVRGFSDGFWNSYFLPPKPDFPAINQPPGTLLILRGTYELYLLTAKVLTHILHLPVGSTLWINDNLQIFFFRFPSIVSDLLLGLCVYLVVRKKMSEKVSLISSAFFLLNPAVLYNSTVWGQMDSVNNALMYLSILFMLRKNAIVSTLFFASSLFVKVSLLPLLPVYLLFGFFGPYFKKKTFLVALIVAVCAYLLVSLPFFQSPAVVLGFLLKNAGGESQLITVGALNFWWLLFQPMPPINPPDVTAQYFGVTLVFWGTVIFGILYSSMFVSGLTILSKTKPKVSQLFLLFFLIMFATFLFLPRMHERYLYPVLPFLMTFIGLRGRYWFVTIVLSMIHFLNLYLIWNPNLFLFGPLEKTLTDQFARTIMTVLTILIFFYFYRLLLPSLRLSLKFLAKIIHFK